MTKCDGDGKKILVNYKKGVLLTFVLLVISMNVIYEAVLVCIVPPGRLGKYYVEG